MKLAGLLLLLAGWAIAMTAVAVLPSAGARSAFLLAGLAVQGIGLTIVFRAHLIVEKEDRR